MIMFLKARIILVLGIQVILLSSLELQAFQKNPWTLATQSIFQKNSSTILNKHFPKVQNQALLEESFKDVNEDFLKEDVKTLKRKSKNKEQEGLLGKNAGTTEQLETWNKISLRGKPMIGIGIGLFALYLGISSNIAIFTALGVMVLIVALAFLQKAFFEKKQEAMSAENRTESYAQKAASQKQIKLQTYLNIFSDVIITAALAGALAIILGVLAGPALILGVPFGEFLIFIFAFLAGLLVPAYFILKRHLDVVEKERNLVQSIDVFSDLVGGSAFDFFEAFAYNKKAKRETRDDDRKDGRRYFLLYPNESQILNVMGIKIKSSNAPADIAYGEVYSVPKEFYQRNVQSKGFLIFAFFGFSSILIPILIGALSFTSVSSLLSIGFALPIIGASIAIMILWYLAFTYYRYWSYKTLLEHPDLFHEKRDLDYIEQNLNFGEKSQEELIQDTGRNFSQTQVKEWESLLEAWKDKSKKTKATTKIFKWIKQQKIAITESQQEFFNQLLIMSIYQERLLIEQRDESEPPISQQSIELLRQALNSQDSQKVEQQLGILLDNNSGGNLKPLIRAFQALPQRRTSKKSQASQFLLPETEQQSTTPLEQSQSFQTFEQLKKQFADLQIKIEVKPPFDPQNKTFEEEIASIADNYWDNEFGIVRVNLGSIEQLSANTIRFILLNEINQLLIKRDTQDIDINRLESESILRIITKDFTQDQLQEIINDFKQYLGQIDTSENSNLAKLPEILQELYKNYEQLRDIQATNQSQYLIEEVAQALPNVFNDNTIAALRSA